MSFDKFDWHKSYGMSGVASSARSVAYIVFDLADGRTGDKAYTSLELLAERTGLNERQVRRNLAVNVDAGWLTLVSKGSNLGRGGKGKASEYRLSYPEHRTLMSSDPECREPGTVDTDVTESPEQWTSMSKTVDIDVHLSDPGPDPEGISDPLLQSHSDYDVHEGEPDTHLVPSPVEPKTADAGKEAGKSPRTRRFYTGDSGESVTLPVDGNGDPLLPDWVTDEHREAAARRSLNLVRLCEMASSVDDETRVARKRGEFLLGRINDHKPARSFQYD